MQDPPRTAKPAQSTTGASLRWALVAGAAAGAFSALAEYGATWLWLPVWRDRGGLLVRLLATLVPLGAALALLGSTLFGLSLLLARRWFGADAARGTALIWTLCSAPFARALAVKLCSGGMMSRLAQHDLIAWSLTLLLTAELRTTTPR